MNKKTDNYKYTCIKAVGRYVILNKAHYWKAFWEQANIIPTCNMKVHWSRNNHKKRNKQVLFQSYTKERIRKVEDHLDVNCRVGHESSRLSKEDLVQRRKLPLDYEEWPRVTGRCEDQ